MKEQRELLLFGVDSVGVSVLVGYGAVLIHWVKTDIGPLKKIPPHYLETSITSHSVTRRQIPE